MPNVFITYHTYLYAIVKKLQIDSLESFYMTPSTSSSSFSIAIYVKYLKLNNMIIKRFSPSFLVGTYNINTCVYVPTI